MCLYQQNPQEALIIILPRLLNIIINKGSFRSLVSGLSTNLERLMLKQVRRMKENKQKMIVFSDILYTQCIHDYARTRVYQKTNKKVLYSDRRFPCSYQSVVIL